MPGNIKPTNFTITFDVVNEDAINYIKHAHSGCGRDKDFQDWSTQVETLKVSVHFFQAKI